VFERSRFMDSPVLPYATLTACALFTPLVAPAASPAATSKETPVASIATPSHTFRVITPPLEPSASVPASGGLLRLLLEKPPESACCSLTVKTLDRRRLGVRLRAG